MIKIAIDSGTTNCRVKFIEGSTVRCEKKGNVGIKDVAATGSVKVLVDTIRELITKGLFELNLETKDIDYVVGSGMITSNLGLMEIPHLLAPADYKTFGDNLKELHFDWLEERPFFLVPGMKNIEAKHIEELEQIDVMRGEEAEAFGAIRDKKLGKKNLLILPGSHTKYVEVDRDGALTSCATTMLGELLSALQESTILKDTIPQGLVESIDEKYINIGAAYHAKYGLSRAAFATRLLQIQLTTTPNARANFIAGALVADDLNDDLLKRIVSDEFDSVVLGGSDPLKSVFNHVLVFKGVAKEKITILDEMTSKHAPAMGAIKIVDYYLSKRREKEGMV